MKGPTSLMLLFLLVGVALGKPRPTPIGTGTSYDPNGIQKWCRLNFGPAWGGRGC